ncbi:MAG TPA: hypothetical protein ENG24_00115 [Thermoplasmatales archaeon]|nr:hypothetical protein [Thermoplasmatales archaeon]
MPDGKKNKYDLTSVIDSEIDILKRHVKVLNAVAHNGPIGIIRLSEITGYPQHMVRYSLHVLEQKNIIKPSTKGAIVTDRFKEAIETLKKALTNINSDIEDILSELS